MKGMVETEAKGHRSSRGNAEHSVSLRIAVLVTVLLAATAVLVEVGIAARLWVIVWVGIPIGFAWSHWRRHDRNILLKALLAFGVLLAFARFLSIVSTIPSTGAAQLQVPLAELFIWVQFLHSLDVPARRDLMFSLSSSTALMIVAAVLSVSMKFGPFLAAWGVFAVASLVLSYRSEIADVPGLGEPPTRCGSFAHTSKVTALASLAVVLVGILVFAFLPRTQAMTTFSFPAALQRMVRLPSEGGLANPSLGPVSDAGRAPTQTELSKSARFGYFGFARELDTGLRGRPDDTLVMRVRASEPAFWRGQSFDRWDGRNWSVTRDRPDRVSGQGGPIEVPLAPYDTSFGTRQLVQTYHLEVTGPNMIFAAYAPERLYFPDNAVFQLPDGSLRAGVELGAGAVYTVVSTRKDVTPAILRQADTLPLGIDPTSRALYTQLPKIPERIRMLAETVTASATSTYDKVIALQDWLARNTTYSLDIPSLPEGTDAVDQFLFVDRRGFCEQIGSSLVVMLRSLGIPARLVVGYVPGERNPLSGMFEVRASDAHAWAEVWFPGVGWQGFDPTAEVPLAGEQGADLAGGDLLAWVAGRLPGLLRLLPAGLVVACLAFVIWGLHVSARRLLGRRSFRRRTWPAQILSRIESAGRRVGRTRAPSETAPEFISDLGRKHELSDEDARELGAILEAASFGRAPVNDAQRQHAEALVAVIERNSAARRSEE